MKDLARGKKKKTELIEKLSLIRSSNQSSKKCNEARWLQKDETQPTLSLYQQFKG